MASYMTRASRQQRAFASVQFLVIAWFLLAAIAKTQAKEINVEKRTNSTAPHSNHLVGESSPYLLAHAHNPVDWYPWSPEALARAKQLGRPIFLSIGYSACHWCHVMERESFENEAIARLLNDHFVSIKVDREQRPDLDQIYMTFTQSMTGSGGWPMSVFLTPDLKPFFAGTYFPPDDRYGRPRFAHILTEISAAYLENPQSIAESSHGIFLEITKHLNRAGETALLNERMIASGAEALIRAVDPVHGGIGSAPKFPHPVELSLFLRHYSRSGDLTYLQAAEKALTAMAHGGINDQIAGGFARYSTDQKWLVPHFEKMLYDNALLAVTYADAFQITHNDFYRDVVIGILDFILRDLTDATGGFYSAIDADSEGEEGRFYLWDKAEIDSLLGSTTDLFCRYFNITAEGNFEGRNILNIDANSDRVRREYSGRDFDAIVSRGKARLFEQRTSRIHPHTDDKVLTSWNGLALSALARGYRITGDRRYLDAACRNAEFVTSQLYHNGILTHTYRKGVRSHGEFLEDYAYYLAGLIELFQVDTDRSAVRWLDFARSMADRAVTQFIDSDGRLFLRPSNQSDLIFRPAEETDGATPAPGSIMIGNLLKLHRLTDHEPFLKSADQALKGISGKLSRYPSGMASALLALDYYLGDKIEIVITGSGSEREAMLRFLYQRYLPTSLLAVSASGLEKLPLFEGRESVNGVVRAFVCKNSVCGLPATDALELKDRLSSP